ncbi:hypothetical protein GCK32_012313 [Trichostrongylus colubriformis]|uniref:Peptidase M13 C-terminal domain-containing protein n=1 Tax=Trichostrongylus colubriformis TaxID=6319 RepID=A0AAN8G0G3_TRICO
MKQTDANLVNQLLTNPHAPGSCRTNQVMQDIPAFGKDFGCRQGSPMYPKPDQRCKVWYLYNYCRLPGLEQFSPNQIFWITYGYSWCMKQTDANLVNQLLTNPHAPGSCRTNQVMQDIPAFGKDFGCRQGSPMYPKPDQRCKVWVGY